LEWHEDETIVSKFDIYGCQGVDLADPKTGEGSRHYRRWRDRQEAKANKYEIEEVIDAEEIRKSEAAFNAVSEQVFGEIGLAEAGIKLWPKK
jgi:hypothetical protein